MTVEGGAKAGLIPPDEETLDYLRSRLSESEFESLKPIVPDSDASYFDKKTYSGSEATPMIALPSYDDVSRLHLFGKLGTKVFQTVCRIDLNTLAGVLAYGHLPGIHVVSKLPHPPADWMLHSVSSC